MVVLSYSHLFAGGGKEVEILPGSYSLPREFFIQQNDMISKIYEMNTRFYEVNMNLLALKNKLDRLEQIYYDDYMSIDQTCKILMKSMQEKEKVITNEEYQKRFPTHTPNKEKVERFKEKYEKNSDSSSSPNTSNG